MKKILSILVLTTALSACSTVVSGTQQSMFIDTPHVEGAKCELADSKKGSWYLPATPGNVTVSKGNGPMNIVCRKPGHKTVAVSVDEGFAGATLGNVILGGGIGIFVDAVSGAAQKYPDKVVIWMEPTSFKSEAARKAWKTEKAEFEKKVAEAKEAQQAAQQRRNYN